MLKRILIGALLAPLMALAQSYPSPTFNNATVNGTLNAAHIGLTTPLPVTSGGTGSATASGTSLDNVAGFSSTGFLTRTGAGAYAFQSLANGITFGNLAQAPANTVLANATGSTANLAAFGMPGCNAAGSALTWIAGSGFGCNSGLIASSALGTGVQTALGIATNGSGGMPLVNGAMTAGDCLQWSSSGLLDSGAPCYDTKVVNVKTYGALGNSNGTHANGNDDTTAFQNAWVAGANKTIFIPCGTYRLTSAIAVTDNSPRTIKGNGTCTKIFNDQATANITFYFSPASGTCSSSQFAPCLYLSDLVFIAPNVSASGQVAVSLTNWNAPYFNNVTFVNQYVAISLASSYAPKVNNSLFMNGTYGIYSADLSMHAASITNNGFYAVSSYALYIAPSSGCAVGVNIAGNDFESNQTSILFGGVCGSSVHGNYFENYLNTQNVMGFSGTNKSIDFRGNAMNSDVATLTISNLDTSEWRDNTITNTTVAYGSGVSKVRLRASENYLSASTLPATTVACTGLGTGGTCSVTGDDYAGQVALSSGSASTGSTGAITVNFTNAIGANGSSCTLAPVNGTASWTTPTLVGSSQGVSSNAIVWTNASALTASKVYFAEYLCQGY